MGCCCWAGVGLQGEWLLLLLLLGVHLQLLLVVLLLLLLLVVVVRVWCSGCVGWVVLKQEGLLEC
jgi:hypothetical protein